MSRPAVDEKTRWTNYKAYWLAVGLIGSIGSQALPWLYTRITTGTPSVHETYEAKQLRTERMRQEIVEDEYKRRGLDR